MTRNEMEIEIAEVNLNEPTLEMGYKYTLRLQSADGFNNDMAVMMLNGKPYLVDVRELKKFCKRYLKANKE